MPQSGAIKPNDGKTGSMMDGNQKAAARHQAGVAGFNIKTAKTPFQNFAISSYYKQKRSKSHKGATAKDSKGNVVVSGGR